MAKEVPELYEQLHQLSQLRAAYLGVTNQLFDRMLVCVCVCVCVCTCVYMYTHIVGGRGRLFWRDQFILGCVQVSGGECDGAGGDTVFCY